MGNSRDNPGTATTRHFHFWISTLPILPVFVSHSLLVTTVIFATFILDSLVKSQKFNAKYAEMAKLHRVNFLIFSMLPLCILDVFCGLCIKKTLFTILSFLISVQNLNQYIKPLLLLIFSLSSLEFSTSHPTPTTGCLHINRKPYQYWILWDHGHFI